MPICSLTTAGSSGKGETQLQAGLSACSQGLGDLVVHLLALYLERKQAQLSAAVEEYLMRCGGGGGGAEPGAQAGPAERCSGGLLDEVRGGGGEGGLAAT